MSFKLNFDIKHLVKTSLVFVFLTLVYALPNKIILTDPWLVPLTKIDTLIPFSSVWIWAYISYYPFIFGAALFIQDHTSRKLIFYSYLASASIASVVFFSFPSVIPREFYPVLEYRSISDVVLSIIRFIDSSTNCAPSMHICLTLIATLCVWTASKKYGPIAFLWFLLIAYSTMATKQHYFIDVVTGAVLGLTIWALTYKMIQIQKAKATL